MVLTAYAVISPATNSYCHRRRRIEGLVRPGRADENLRRLDTSNGCQDHTVLPSAPAPFVPRRLSAHGFLRSRPAIIARDDASLRPPHPIPTFVTMANAPLSGRDGEACADDLGRMKTGIFFQGGLDRPNHRFGPLTARRSQAPHRVEISNARALTAGWVSLASPSCHRSGRPRSRAFRRWSIRH